MTTDSPPQCVAAPFSVTQARARLLAGAEDVARAARDLQDPGLAWDGPAHDAYEDAVLAERTGLGRVGAAIDRCVVLLDAFTVAAEQDVARSAARQGTGGLS